MRRFIILFYRDGKLLDMAFDFEAEDYYTAEQILANKVQEHKHSILFNQATLFEVDDVKTIKL